MLKACLRKPIFKEMSTHAKILSLHKIAGMCNYVANKRQENKPDDRAWDTFDGSHI